jgi:glycine cleavage system aminomethyltransferase T
VSVKDSPPPTPSTLDSVVAHAGGVFTPHSGPWVAINYGSAAGELAACVSSVGLADRSELTKLLLTGSTEAIDAVATRFSGATVARGGARFTGGAWWCRPAGGQMIVIAEPERGQRLRGQLRGHLARSCTVTLEEQSEAWAAIAVVGRRAGQLLSSLGVYGPSGDPRHVQPLTPCAIGGVGALWLLESDDEALAIVPRDRAASAWQTIERAGRAFGLCAVGREAVIRYSLIRRARRPL